jgi:hypothetical protein
MQPYFASYELRNGASGLSQAANREAVADEMVETVSSKLDFEGASCTGASG